MKSTLRLCAIWSSAGLVAALPWVFHWRPWMAPAVAGLAFVLLMAAPRSRAADPWSPALVLGSCAVYLVAVPGWVVAATWLVLAGVVGGAAKFLPRRIGRGRPDSADLVAVVGWAAAPMLLPNLMEVSSGGWLAPAILLLAARRFAQFSVRNAPPRHFGPAPPSRAVRGTLSLRGVVLASQNLPRSIPIDLELRAGESLSILCDNALDGEALAEVLSGRRAPAEGEVAVDAVPLQADDRLVTVIGAGELFHPGDIEVNVSSLCQEDLEPETVAAIAEACALDEVLHELGDQPLRADGSPLGIHHRLLLLAARVVPSQYRVVVVLDPVSWLNAVQGELWRGAVVRACVGRTAVWITTDRDLAARATQTMQFRHGALRSFEGFQTKKG